MKMNLHRKISIVLISALLISALAFGQTAAVFGAGETKNKVKRPEITAKNAIVYCQNTGEIIYSKNREYRNDPYSITKLMTVMLAVQNLPLDKEVTVSKTAASQTESTMGLKKGEVVTVKDLIYGAMLPSGNDAAYALGEAVSGSGEKFVKLMNKTASNIGCKHTRFKNPSGLEEKGHYTTAEDMMLITKVAFSNDVVRTAAGAKTYKMKKTNKSKARILKTHNTFITDSNSGVYAGKTGFWDENNCTIALGYKKNGLHLYIVLLGDTQAERTKDVKKLIQYAKEKVEGVPVVGKDVEEGKVRIKHGAKTRLKVYTAEKGYAYLPKEASKSLIETKVVMKSDVKAPVNAGDVVGKLDIYAADELVNEVDLIIKEDVEEGWFTSYLGISNLAAVLLCLAVVLLFILYSWIAVMKANQRRRKKAARRRKIMEMARAELEREQDLKERDWRF